MEKLTWWHEALRLVITVANTEVITTINVNDSTYQIQLLHWQPATGALTCRLNNTVYRWQRLTPLNQSPVVWYSYHHDATLSLDSQRPRTEPKPSTGSANESPIVTSPLAGRVVRILVKKDEKVTAHQPLLIIEAMKMENEIRAPRDGCIKTVFIGLEDMVEVGQSLLAFKA